MTEPSPDMTAGFVPVDDPGGTRTVATDPILSAHPTQTSPPGRELSVLGTPPTIPGFEIVRELGRGGMGVVYLARQLKLNRVVALKTILAGGHASNTDLTRFLAEAEAAAAVQHPNVALVYELGTHDGRPYFALEYCSGGSLAGKLAGTPLPPADAAAMVCAVARGVQVAHDQGIVHRDLKPGNVLLAADGTPKVTDFGLARRTESASGLTATGAVLGSPSYMAPEQARGGGEGIGPGTDVYGLAAILYECLTGRPPFRAASAMETVAQVLKDDPLPPRVLVPGVPRDLETICLKGLQKDPARRYSTATALTDDLQRFLEGVPILARPVPWWERAWKAAKRRPTAVAAAAAILLGVLSTAGVVAWKNRELGEERDAARTAETEAHEMRAEADQQRTRAHARLLKAVEVVEKMVTRVGTGQWARNPALAAERRAVLEDVVAFYEGFGEAKDPVIRRETARAYRRIGMVYLLLAEYPKAADYLGRAKNLCEQLVAEFPNDPADTTDLAEARLYVAFEAASVGRVADALVGYHDATIVARQAAAARPDDDETLRILVACLIGHGFFTMQADVPLAAGLFREAIGHADELLARPAATFASRALAAYTYAAAATFDYRDAKVSAGNAKVKRASTIIAETPPDPAAPARYRDLFDLTTGILKMHRAAGLAASPKPDRAAPLFREAAETFDRLLAVYPKAFQFQLYKLLILNQEVQLLVRLRREEEAGQRRNELLATEEAILKTSPNMTIAKQLAASQRSTALAYQALTENIPDLDQRATDLLSTFGRDPAGSVVQYNVACALSLGSRYGAPADREARAVRAVQLLTDLLDGTFYRGPTDANHIDADTDLDPIRGRADFRAFRLKLGPARAPAPRPTGR